MPHLVLWLLLTMPADPAQTLVGGTFRDRQACEEVQVAQFLQGAYYRCQAVTIRPAIGPHD